MNRYKSLAFKITTLLVVPLLTILVLESGLRLVGFGYDTSVFVEEKGIVRSNWPFTFKYFPWSVARPMKSLRFKAKKDPGSLRIFVLGGSAAQGFPAVEFGMSSQVQVMLEQAYPARKIEVFNAAITAVNSHVMLPVAKACLQYDPDFLIVYMGNNEVVGPYGAGTVFSGFSDNLVLLRLSESIKTMRLYQLLVVLTGSHKSPTGTWRGMEYFLENTLFEDDERLRTVYKHFDRNLGDLISTAADENCPVILSTVGVNLLDCPPFASKESDPADAQYHLGLTNLKAGKTEEALVAFKKARDLDGLRFRADSTLNAVIRDQAVRNKGRVTLVDSERLIERGDTGATTVPGEDYLYDHVHLSFAGNFTVARAMSEAVIAHADPSAEFSTSMETVASALAYSEWDQLQISRKLTEQLFDKPPFTNQWNHRDKQLKRHRELRKMTARFSPEAKEKSWKLYQTVLDAWPGNQDLKLRMSRLLAEIGNPEKARELLLSAVNDAPENIEAFFELSQVAVSMDKFEEAEQSILKILEHNPYAIEARNAYLLLLFNSKRFDEAVRYCEKMIDDHPADPDLGYVFALILKAQEKGSEALESLRVSLQIDPKHDKARSLMIEMLRRENEIVKALQVAHAWSLVDPGNPKAHFEEAELLSQKKDYKAALERYKKAVELDPDFVIARSNYVQLMASQGHIDEAIQCLSEQLEQDPDIREGYSMFGLALDIAGRRKEALQVFAAGLEREPDDLKILRELAWIKATSKDAHFRNGPEALQLARRAVELNPNHPDFQQVLAAAYAENRQFENAIRSARRGIQLADANNNRALSDFIRRCIPAYENNQPIRVD